MKSVSFLHIQIVRLEELHLFLFHLIYTYFAQLLILKTGSLFNNWWLNAIQFMHVLSDAVQIQQICKGFFQRKTVVNTKVYPAVMKPQNWFVYNFVVSLAIELQNEIVSKYKKGSCVWGKYRWTQVAKEMCKSGDI